MFISFCVTLPLNALFETPLYRRPSWQSELIYACCWIRDVVVCTLTRPRVGWSGVWIPIMARDFPLLQTVQTGSGAHPASYSMGTGVLSRGAKRSGPKVDSPPSSAAIMNEWSYTSNSPMCLDGMERANFTFTSVLELGQIYMHL